MTRSLFSLIWALSSTSCFAALSTGFEDLQLTTPTTRYATGSSFNSQGIKFTVVPYPEKLQVSVTGNNYAKGGGKELYMGGGVGVAISIPPQTTSIGFKFGQYNSYNGLTINGQSTSRQLSIKYMNGISVGGVAVSVVSSPSLAYGTVTLTGAIETLTIGGTEFAIDDLSITAPVADPAFADFNGDMVVDGTDFLRWQRNLGKASATRSDGDADNDQDVDRADLLAWRYHYSSAVSAAEAVAVVPEPAAIIMAMMATIPIVALSGVRRPRLA
ncbi:hypothetical protein [Lacipirellula parvula]|uniref:PEP-CTERM protein-sorting domain-containing protein n=1 Tax=Lacipirellula parvula TaxID=2650471 RepID=A0A5K7X806_9BACT|nr:hypothetical protein [Lacipirellula parvula]BBO32914.1 hypothetical protein PLANPX_2526 [Lacipirellula parvula]